jgi:hypothetical protein
MKKNLFILTVFLLSSTIYGQKINKSGSFIKKSANMHIENQPYFGSYTTLLKQQQQAAKTASTSCNNLDLDDGNYNGWFVYKGENQNSLQSPSNVITDTTATVTGINVLNSFNSVIDSINSFEAYSTSTVTVKSPYSSSSHIARVNHVGYGGNVGILEKIIPITTSNTFVNFSYFAFLENSPHTISEQPYFKIFFFDSNNDTIPGTFLQVTSNTSGANAGFSTVDNYFYKPWTPVSVDLSAYIGQTVTAQFIAADCVISQGAHGGHIYIDFDCYSSGPAVQNTWPGDANSDLTVNFADLFYIGAGYNTTGIPRATIDNSFSAFPSTDWSTNSLYLVNSKHADCNGDGTINGLDTIAVNQNYGMTHQYKNNVTQLVALNTALQNSITITSTIDSVAYGQNLSLSFNIGSQTTLVDSLYGIGFSLNYPTNLIDPLYTNQSCNSSVLGTYGTNLIKLAQPLNNAIDMVAVKTDQQNKTNFYGNLFTLNLKANQFITNDSIFNFSISNIKAITKSGYNVPIGNATKSIVFKSNEITGIKNKVYELTSIYPNPAQNTITISCPTKIKHYEITSVLGNVIKQSSINSISKVDINISDLAKSAYFISITTENGNKIVKQFIKL